MVVRIRLQRFGCVNRPFYRIVAANSKAPRDGKFLEILGNYNPIPQKDGVKEIIFNSERIKYWISVGAQPSDRVAWLLAKCDILPAVPTRNSVSYSLPKFIAKQKK
mmetsp:Transcript_8971/g.8010  ORF Transcript_8971/g.8010 Transcript_8971/m.8010 type:complete len:106 (+) Transcript_8971:21-338(+)